MNSDVIIENFCSSIKGLTQYFQQLYQFIFSFELTPGIEYSDSQLALLQVVLILLITLVVLTGIYWQKYGDIITEKFIRPSTLKEIEELKLSVAKLKLPKEHSPRI